MTRKTAALENIPGDRALKVNVEGTGNYRVQYDQPSWKLLFEAFPKLGVPDRVNLLSDAWALVQANRAPLSLYFGLVEKLPAATELAEREQIIMFWRSSNGLLTANPNAKNSSRHARSLCVQVSKRLAGSPKLGNHRAPEACARA